MKILATAAHINSELARLVVECESCQVAVAWASSGFPAYDLLTQHGAKIRRMIVGTHFFQTDPKFIEHFKGHPNVRFILTGDGVFHPKVYLFHKSGEHWECLIGSPNFTGGGFGKNAEVAVLISSSDYDAHNALADLIAQIETFWTAGAIVNDARLESYRKTWETKRLLVQKLQRKFGKPGSDSGDRGKDPADVQLLNWEWAEYFQQVKQEENRGVYAHSMTKRLEMLDEIRKLFSASKYFSDISPDGRKRIAGMARPKSGEPNYRWFGGTGNGVFMNAVNDKAVELSCALDHVARYGPISREAYMAFIADFRNILPKQLLIASATRLLAMKRPDYFVCLNGHNATKLCKAFGISRKVGFEEYWDSIIERVQEAVWWNAPPPATETERKVWDARVAFLDAWSYDGKDMPSPVS